MYSNLNPRIQNSTGFLCETMYDQERDFILSRWHTPEGKQHFLKQICVFVQGFLVPNVAPDLKWTDEMNTFFISLVSSQVTKTDKDMIEGARRLADKISNRVLMSARLETCKRTSNPFVTWTQDDHEKGELEHPISGSPFYKAFLSDQKARMQ
jgi:hypothetical protein